MAIVTIQAPSLSETQKKRVGERILDSLHSEGVPASSIVVLFRRDDTDVFLDGGLLFDAKPQHGSPAVSHSAVTTVSKRPTAVVASAPAPQVVSAKVPAPAPAPALVSIPVKGRERGKGRGRAASAPQQTSNKPLPSYSEAKEKIRTMLLNHGGLSSFQAQSGLDLKGHEGASALLRKIFADLELEGMVEKQGQKRGTRYILKGIAATPPQQLAPVKLVKHDKQDKQEEAHGAHGAHVTSGHIGHLP
jgi:hypothetical protein